MKRVLRIGMVVHSTNYTLCTFEPVFEADDIVYANVKVSPDAVHIPTDKDETVKLYLQMRDEHKSDLKKLKQRISAYCLSQGGSL